MVTEKNGKISPQNHTKLPTRHHPEAMIYALGIFGFKIEDSKIDAGAGETTRNVSVYI